MISGGNQALTDFTEQACYGNGFEDYLIPSCQGGEKIFIHNVFVYAKRKELNCPQIATYFDRNITFCCNYVSEKEDCGQRYFGISSDFEHAHYSRCTGQATCAGIPVAWNYTEHFCDVTFFEERTNYMKMWYNCIPDISSISINSASLMTGSQVFLSSENYPASMPDCSTTSGATCSVQTSDGSSIRITALDLQFSQKSGVCQQRIHITDMLTNTDISCQENNQFVKTKIYESSGGSIEIRLDNTATATEGKFWIQIEASGASGRVSVECRDEAAVYQCGSSLPMTSQDALAPTVSAYTTSTDIGVSTTGFLSSSEYKTVSDQRFTDIVSSTYTKTSEYKSNSEVGMSSIYEKSTDNLIPALSEYYRTTDQISTSIKDTYTSLTRETMESLTIPIMEKSSIYLENSKILDMQSSSQISSEYFRKSSEVSSLTYDMSSETSKTFGFSTLSDTRSSKYMPLESSLLDSVYLSTTSEHYKTTSETLTSMKDILVSTKQVIQMSEIWTTTDMEKSSVYLDSSVYSKYFSPTKSSSDTLISTKEIVSSFSDIRNTSAFITKVYTEKSSLDLESSSNLDPRYVSHTSLEYHQMTTETLTTFKESRSTKIAETTNVYISSSMSTLPKEYSSDTIQHFLFSSSSKATDMIDSSSSKFSNDNSDSFVYIASSDAQSSSTFEKIGITPSSVVTTTAEIDLKWTTTTPASSNEITSSRDIGVQSMDTFSGISTSLDSTVSSVNLMSSYIQSTTSNDIPIMTSFWAGPSLSSSALSTMSITSTSSLIVAVPSSSPVSTLRSLTVTPSSSSSVSSSLSSKDVISSSVSNVSLPSTSSNLAIKPSTATSASSMMESTIWFTSITIPSSTSGATSLVLSASSTMSLTPTVSVTESSTSSMSSETTQPSTTASSSNSTSTEQDLASSKDPLDLSWIFTIFPALIGAATVVGSIGYALNRLRKKCIQVNAETPRRRIAFA
ncbi:uncharacterized protein LOC111137278 [Crassostrea virginica]